MGQKAKTAVVNCMTLRKGKKLGVDESGETCRLRPTQSYSVQKVARKARKSFKMKPLAKLSRDRKVVYPIGLWMKVLDWYERDKPLCHERDGVHEDPFMQCYDTVRDAFLLLKVVNMLE